ncbi:MAG: hypothetical protein AAF791_02825 [Bacteroidota bacterium]
MCAALALPDDLAPDERATVEAVRARAVAEAEERAALAIRVRREHDRLVRRDGMSYGAALDVIAGDPHLPVTRATAKRMVDRSGAWAT